MDISLIPQLHQKLLQLHSSGIALGFYLFGGHGVFAPQVFYRGHAGALVALGINIRLAFSSVFFIGGSFDMSLEGFGFVFQRFVALELCLNAGHLCRKCLPVA